CSTCPASVVMPMCEGLQASSGGSQNDVVDARARWSVTVPGEAFAPEPGWPRVPWLHAASAKDVNARTAGRTTRRAATHMPAARTADARVVRILRHPRQPDRAKSWCASVNCNKHAPVAQLDRAPAF